VVKRGEVWLVVLDPTVGREIRKTRPAVVLSPDELNAAVDTVVVAPMTTGASPAPFRVDVTVGTAHGLILVDQMRAVDRQRLLRRVARLPGKTLGVTLRVAQEMFAE
jgi:mRNA interferase MazF